MKLIRSLMVLMVFLVCTAQAHVTPARYKTWRDNFNAAMRAKEYDVARSNFILLEGAFNYDKSSQRHLVDVARVVQIPVFDQKFINGLLGQLQQAQDQAVLAVLDEILTEIGPLYYDDFPPAIVSKNLEEALRLYFKATQLVTRKMYRIKAQLKLKETDPEVSQKLDEIKSFHTSARSKIEELLPEFIQHVTHEKHMDYAQKRGEAMKAGRDFVAQGQFKKALEEGYNGLMYAILSAIEWSYYRIGAFFFTTELGAQEVAELLNDNDHVDKETQDLAEVLSYQCELFDTMVKAQWQRLTGEPTKEGAYAHVIQFKVTGGLSDLAAIIAGKDQYLAAFNQAVAHNDLEAAYAAFVPMIKLLAQYKYLKTKLNAKEKAAMEQAAKTTFAAFDKIVTPIEDMVNKKIGPLMLSVLDNPRHPARSKTLEYEKKYTNALEGYTSWIAESKFLTAIDFLVNMYIYASMYYFAAGEKTYLVGLQAQLKALADNRKVDAESRAIARGLLEDLESQLEYIKEDANVFVVG